jgi:hypothetical protein
MPEKLERTSFVDTEPDLPEDQNILHPASPVPPIPSDSINVLIPSSPRRFERLDLMPPPSETSVTASRALGKEFKECITLQTEGKLPFYMNPESER